MALDVHCDETDVPSRFVELLMPCSTEDYGGAPQPAYLSSDLDNSCIE